MPIEATNFINTSALSDDIIGFLLRNMMAEPYVISNNTYSWGKTARLQTEPAFLEVYGASNKDLLAVDLCSSYPHLRQIMVGQHKQRMETEAGKVTGEFVEDLHAPARRNKLPFTASLDRDTLVALRNVISPRRGLARRLLLAPVFETLVNPPPSKVVGQRTAAGISGFLCSNFEGSDRVIEAVIEPDGKRGDKGNWVHLVSANTGTTLSDILKPILRNKTFQFLDDAASYFGTHLEENNKLRSVTFVSLDVSPLDQIIERAQQSFPDKMKNTLFFKSAQESGRHIQADIAALPFGQRQVDFFSSVEGWPYYGRRFGKQGNVSIANQISHLLALGGKAVFFPWGMRTNDQKSREILEAVEDQWRRDGLVIKKQEFTRQDILYSMTDRELVLARHSPLLKAGPGSYTTLTLSQPGA